MTLSATNARGNRGTANAWSLARFFGRQTLTIANRRTLLSLPPSSKALESARAKSACARKRNSYLPRASSLQTSEHSP